jgi:hypothetical protein
MRRFLAVLSTGVIAASLLEGVPNTSFSDQLGDPRSTTIVLIALGLAGLAPSLMAALWRPRRESNPHQANTHPDLVDWYASASTTTEG